MRCIAVRCDERWGNDAAERPAAPTRSPGECDTDGVFALRWLVLAALLGLAACAVLLVPLSTAGAQPGATLTCGNTLVRSDQLSALRNPGGDASTASAVWMSSDSFNALRRCERLRDYTRVGAGALAVLAAGSGWLAYRRRTAVSGQ